MKKGKGRAQFKMIEYGMPKRDGCFEEIRIWEYFVIPINLLI